MLSLLVIIPIAAFLAVLSGAQARRTALGAAVINLVIAAWAVADWENRVWEFSIQVLARPEINLSLDRAATITVDVYDAAGHKVAVTAVDPSSTVTGGSVLGDKTRMEKLGTDPAAFVRPSPSSGTLGGGTRKTRETILLFEAAGYDVVIVETVGVGQSETLVREMVDFFLLVLIAGGGDELQGIKKGVIELADAIVINKADGDNMQAAELARAEYERALHYLRPATRGWQSRAHSCSALTGEGVAELWRVVERFMELAHQDGVLDQRRRAQERHWLRQLVRDQLEEMFLRHGRIATLLPELEAAVERGEVPAVSAARRLLDIFENDRSR